MVLDTLACQSQDGHGLVVGRDAEQADPGHAIVPGRAPRRRLWKRAEPLFEVTPCGQLGSTLVGVDVDADDAGMQPESDVAAGMILAPGLNISRGCLLCGAAGPASGRGL